MSFTFDTFENFLPLFAHSAAGTPADAHFLFACTRVVSQVHQCHLCERPGACVRANERACVSA